MFIESPAFARIARSMIGALAVVALVGQLLLPAMAHASMGTDVGGEWIEICADAGPVLVRLRDDGTVEKRAPQAPGHGTCPKCLTCVTCATMVGINPGDVVPVGVATVACALGRVGDESVVFVSTTWNRPMTRGPPCVTQYKNEMARAGHEMTATLTMGGAL